MSTDSIMILRDRTGKIVQAGFQWEEGCASDYFTAFCKMVGMEYGYRNQQFCADWNRDGNLVPITYKHVFGSMFEILPK